MLKLIWRTDSELFEDQAVTLQLLRASKPMNGLPATITLFGGEFVNIFRTLAPMLGSPTLRITREAIRFDVIGECFESDGHFPRSRRPPDAGQDLASAISRGGTLDVFRDRVGSVLLNHWRIHPSTTFSKILSFCEFQGLFSSWIWLSGSCELLTDRQIKILIGFVCMKARHRSLAFSSLMQVHFLQVFGEHSHDSIRSTFPPNVQS